MPFVHVFALVVVHGYDAMGLALYFIFGVALSMHFFSITKPPQLA
jgi:hypothetical protein